MTINCIPATSWNGQTYGVSDSLDMKIYVHVA